MSGQIPVPITPGPLTISQAESDAAELFVARIAQIFANGTTGVVPATPATLTPDGTDPLYDPLTGRPKLKSLVISTPEQQLYYRQLALAFTALISSGGITPPPVVVNSNGPTFTAECPSTTMLGDLMYPMSAAGTYVGFADVADISKLPAIGVVIETGRCPSAPASGPAAGCADCAFQSGIRPVRQGRQSPVAAGDPKPLP